MKAFPHPKPEFGTLEEFQNISGMDLRDYFASNALNGLLFTKASWNVKLVAEEAYELADAMMKAREQI